MAITTPTLSIKDLKTLAIIPVCALCISLSVLVLPIATFGYFRPALEQEFGWSSTALAGAYTFEMLLIMFTLPIAGRMADRFGARRVALISTALYALAIASVGLIGPWLPLFYITYGLIAIAGAGMSQVTFTRVITLWFDKNRALALGLALTGTGLGVAVLPLITQASIDQYGWRAAFFIIAGLVAFVTLPLIYFFIHEPKAHSASDTNSASVNQTASQSASFSLSLSEAMTHRVFWQMVAAFALLGVVVGGITPNLSLLLSDRGISLIEVAKFQFFIGTASIIGRVIGGFLMDRVHAPYIGATFAVMGACSLLLFVHIDTFTAFAIGVALLFGASYGAEGDLVSFLSSRYFGHRAFAEIYGWQVCAYLAGASVAPLAFAFLEDSGFTANTLIYIAAIGFFASALIVGLLGPYSITRNNYSTK